MELPAQPEIPIAPKGFFQTPAGRVVLVVVLLIIIGVAVVVLKHLNLLSAPQINFDLFKKQAQPVTPASSYSIEQLNNSTKKFVEANLQAKYRSEINLEEVPLSKEQKEQFLLGFTDSWEVSSVSAQLAVKYDSIKKVALDTNLTLLVPHSSEQVSNQSVAKILSPYLLASNQTYTCAIKDKIQECSSMNTKEDKSKLGVSFRSNIGREAGGAIDIITVCERVVGSNTYSWTTCLHE